MEVVSLLPDYPNEGFMICSRTAIDVSGHNSTVTCLSQSLHGSSTSLDLSLQTLLPDGLVVLAIKRDPGPFANVCDTLPALPFARFPDRFLPYCNIPSYD